MTGQDNGCGYYWASQRTTASFIDASDILIALCLKHLFFSKGWHLEIIH
jgi:hypothetical protein